MYLSKFLINRQKILDYCAINNALKAYFGRASDYFYRFEWYKIGVSVPVKVISKTMPEPKLVPECRLYETGELPLIKSNSKLKFSIFAVPNFANADNACDNETKAKNWLNKELKNSAYITECGFGPNNCLYYSENGVEKHLQTITISGFLKVKNFEEFNKIRCKALGKFRHLGCGFLDLS